MKKCVQNIIQALRYINAKALVMPVFCVNTHTHTHTHTLPK